jgi:hypothetical protein
MACHGIEWHGRCIPIYEVELKWPPEPDPDPMRHVFDDIRILKTINTGIAAINDRKLRDTLSRAVRDAAGSLALPDGMKLGDGLFKEQKAFMAAK